MIRRFQNRTAVDQLVYNRSRDPVELRPGGIVTGEEYAQWARPYGPLTEIAGLPDPPKAKTQGGRGKPLNEDAGAPPAA